MVDRSSCHKISLAVFTASLRERRDWVNVLSSVQVVAEFEIDGQKITGVPVVQNDFNFGIRTSQIQTFSLHRLKAVTPLGLEASVDRKRDPKLLESGRRKNWDHSFVSQKEFVEGTLGLPIEVEMNDGRRFFGFAGNVDEQTWMFPLTHRGGLERIRLADMKSIGLQSSGPTRIDQLESLQIVRPLVLDSDSKDVRLEKLAESHAEARRILDAIDRNIEQANWFRNSTVIGQLRQMNIRGKQIIAGVKVYGNGNVQTFIDGVWNQDPKLVETINSAMDKDYPYRCWLMKDEP